MSKEMIIHLRTEDDELGARPDDVKAIAEKLNVDEEMAVHIAIGRLRRALFNEDTHFDYPSDEELRRVTPQDDESEVISRQNITDYF